MTIRGGVVEPGFISTDDAQASLSFVPSAFPAHGSDTAIRFAITPQAAAPAFAHDLTARSNFYQITAVYAPSGGSVDPPFTQAPVVTLRYAQHRSDAAIYASPTGKGGWRRLDSCSIQIGVQNVVCITPALGWFVVANPAEAPPAASLPPLLPAALLLLLLISSGGVSLWLLRRRR